MQPVIAVIVAAYNVEKYIKKSLDSIVNQSFKDFECWVINDGSTDKTAYIIDEYALKYPFFKVIHQANAGQSAARNRAIRQTQAPYIAIIDSDDWVEPTFLEELYKKAIQTNADLTFCGQYMVVEGSEEKQVLAEPFKKNYPDSFLFSEYPSVFIDNISIAWNKLYKKSVFEDNNLYFIEGKKYEDLLHGTLILLQVKTIAQVQKPLYNYLINREGATTRMYDFAKFQHVVAHLHTIKHAVQSHPMKKVLDPIVDVFEKQYIYFFLPEYIIRTTNPIEQNKQLELYCMEYGKVQSFINVKQTQTVHFSFDKFTKKIQLLLIVFYTNKNIFKIFIRLINRFLQ